MLLAQLYRKVPHEFEGMEDVLTSSVFGLLKYLPEGLASCVLARCAHIDVATGSPQLELWPRYPTPRGFANPTATEDVEDEPATRGDTEPDAVITTEEWLVLMEAKYRSPLDEAYDQLGREFAIGYQLASEEELQFRLLVVTAHTIEPRPGGVSLVTGVQNALDAASSGLGAIAAQMMDAVPSALRWTNWQTLYRIFGEICDNKVIPNNIHQLLVDIRRLLELRGLKPYDNTSLVSAMDRWREAAIADETWSLPIAYRYRTIASIAIGWEQLLRMDVSDLDSIAWRLRTVTSNYGLDATLGRFELGSLVALCWRPFSQDGGPYERKR